MKISNIRTKIDSDTVTLMADCKIRPVGIDTVYFKFPLKYRNFIYEDASPFAAALLIPSMYFDQSLEIDGTISAKLYEGMHKAQDVLLGWNLKDPRLNRIEIKVKNTARDSASPDKVAMFFSGGVDSFHTFLKHEHDKIDPLTHLILVNGNDIDIRNKQLWSETSERIGAVAKETGKEVIEVETNVQVLTEPMLNPEYTHGGNLGAMGLCLRGGLKKIYIASTFSYEQNMPYGSSPELDYLWSSEVLQFEHDGAETIRVKKVEDFIAKSPLALKYLRVCNRNVKGTYNCGKCEKCTRTMLNLYMAGALDKAQTLPHIIDPKLLACNVSLDGPTNDSYTRLHKTMIEKNIDKELRDAVKWGVDNMITVSQTPKEKIIRGMIRLDHMYLRGFLFKIWLSIVHPY